MGSNPTLSATATSVAMAAALSACAPGDMMGMMGRPSSPPGAMAPIGMTARPDADMQAVLRSAGVPVERRVWDGAVHEFFSMADVVSDAREAQAWSFGRLRMALR